MSLGCCPDTLGIAADMARVCLIIAIAQFLLALGDFTIAVR